MDLNYPQLLKRAPSRVHHIPVIECERSIRLFTQVSRILHDIQKYPAIPLLARIYI